MNQELMLKIIGSVLFITGIICVGGVLYYIMWQDWYYFGWNHFYTWLLIIGIPCLIIGTIMVNKYLRSS